MSKPMNRPQMEAVIRKGQSVLYQGRIISRTQDLPSAAELAAGDPEAEAAVAADVQAQIDALSEQLAKLQAASTSPAAPKGKGKAPAADPQPEKTEV